MNWALNLARLLSAVAEEIDCERAMDLIVQKALDLTGGRHAMIAVLNEEGGHLELRYGSGEDFGHLFRGERLPIDKDHQDGIVSFVAATGESFLSGNVAEVPIYRKLYDSTQSEMAIPIKDAFQRVRAVLNIESDQKDAFNSERREIASSIADLARIVLDRQEHHRREEALMQIGSSLDSVVTEEQLVDRVMKVAEKVLALQACSIFLQDPRTDSFVLRGTIGRLRPQVGKIAYRRGEGLTGWVLQTGEPVLLDDPNVDNRWKGKYVEMDGDQIVSFLAVPIVARKNVIGVMRVLRRTTDNPFLNNRFTQDDMRLLQAIAEQIATGLENVRNMERIIRSERMVAWGELSAKSSHMIGNRMFALKGDVNEMGHLLQEPQPNLKDLKELHQSLLTNVTRVEEILQDFRDFVTATQLTREEVDLNKVVEETATEVFPRRSQIGLDLRLGEIPILSADEKKLRRAISELIENSLNYMEQGKLVIETSVVPSDEYEKTRNSKFLWFARVVVEDTGPGVDQERKNLIFQPFHSSRVKGMGLGLSIVKGIVDAHGGEVFEAGSEGQGAKFVILLPIVS